MKNISYSTHFLINESRNKLIEITQKLSKKDKEDLYDKFSEVETLLKEIHLSQLYLTYSKKSFELNFKFYSQDVKNCEFLLSVGNDPEKSSLVIKDFTDGIKIYHGTIEDLFDDIIYIHIHKNKK